jgi:hypothetical protein
LISPLATCRMSNRPPPRSRSERESRSRASRVDSSSPAPIACALRTLR